MTPDPTLPPIQEDLRYFARSIEHRRHRTGFDRGLIAILRSAADLIDGLERELKKIKEQEL